MIDNSSIPSRAASREEVDLIHPYVNMKVQEKQGRQMRDHDKTAKGRWFKPGDSVLTLNFSLGPKWIQGIMESVTGPVSYKVMYGDGRVVWSQASTKAEAWLGLESLVLVTCRKYPRQIKEQWQIQVQ
ncbi:hypothetical protein VZT92_008501 [Zoarces viviparus]